MKSFLAGVFILSITGFSSLDAQQQVQVNDNMRVEVSYDTQPTPEFQPGGIKTKKVPNPREWLEIEVMFKPEVAPRDAIVSKMMLRYYVAIQSEAGAVQLLTGDINHVNLLGGEENFSIAYVSPSMLGTITGDFRRFQASAVKGVAVEVFHNGVSKGGASSSGSPSGRWWEAMASSAGVLSKDDTPFQLLWIDRYAEVEKQGR